MVCSNKSGVYKLIWSTKKIKKNWVIIIIMSLQHGSWYGNGWVAKEAWRGRLLEAETSLVTVNDNLQISHLAFADDLTIMKNSWESGIKLIET